MKIDDLETEVKVTLPWHASAAATIGKLIDGVVLLAFAGMVIGGCLKCAGVL